MATRTETATKAIRDCAVPALEAFEENARDIRRAVVAGRHAVEDCAAETTLQVRRHPLLTVAVVAGAGAVFGCVVGFTFGRRGHARASVE